MARRHADLRPRGARGTRIALATVDQRYCDLLVLGEMGIGNTTPSAAIAAALAGGEAAAWVGRGTGVDDAALDHCTVGHCSSEPGHRKLLERLGKRPLFDLDMRLGE